LLSFAGFVLTFSSVRQVLAMPGCACHAFLPWTAFQLPGVFSLLLHLAIVIRLHLLHAYWIGQRVACIFLFLVGIGFGHFPGLLCPCSTTLSNNTLDSQLSHLVLPCSVAIATSGWMQLLHHGRCNGLAFPHHQGLSWYLWRGAKNKGEKPVVFFTDRLLSTSSYLQ
jgi:hypothetical protein